MQIPKFIHFFAGHYDVVFSSTIQFNKNLPPFTLTSFPSAFFGPNPATVLALTHTQPYCAESFIRNVTLVAGLDTFCVTSLSVPVNKLIDVLSLCFMLLVLGLKGHLIHFRPYSHCKCPRDSLHEESKVSAQSFASDIQHDILTHIKLHTMMYLIRNYNVSSQYLILIMFYQYLNNEM